MTIPSSSTPPLSPPPPPLPPRPKKEENPEVLFRGSCRGCIQTPAMKLLFLPQKLAFMVSLGLVTHDHLEGKPLVAAVLFKSNPEMIPDVQMSLFFKSQKFRAKDKRGREERQQTLCTVEPCLNPRYRVGLKQKLIAAGTRRFLVASSQPPD